MNLSCSICRRLRGGFVAIVLTGASLTGLAQPALMPLVQPASYVHHVGKVVFAELVTPDLARVKPFYAGLFGWTYQDVQVGAEQYAQALRGGQVVAGLLQRQPVAGSGRQPIWLTYLSAHDVDATLAQARSHGARVLREPHNVAGRGREAVIADPQGAVVGLLESSSGDPAEELADPGEWIWSSLSTDDPDTAAGFYQHLLAYEVFDIPEKLSSQHFMLASENVARFSANSLPAGQTHAHWLNFIRVQNADTTSAQAQSLGGRVLVAPHVDRHGARLAIVADPTGAAFGLLEWPNEQSKELTP